MSQNKVLVIDDDFSTRKSLIYILKQYGYEAIEAGNGKEGISKAKLEKPQLVLVDTVMPDIDGNQVCKEIKKISKDIKVIVFTGVVDFVNAEAARVAGADDYVVKTSEMKYLLEATRKLIG